MKNKIFAFALCAAGASAMVSCDDFLETNSYSEATAEFVFSNMITTRAAMEGAYKDWHGAVSSHVFGDGLFYALDIAGSDIMRHPEGYTSQPARHIPETFYENGEAAGTYDAVTYGKDGSNSMYGVLYAIIGKTNDIINAIEKREDYNDMIAQTSVTDLSQLYGEAIAMRATAYRELIKYFGDVPYVTVIGASAKGLACRDSIYDVLIAELKRVEPLMSPVTTGAKNRFSQTYVDGLIGRMALEAGGYQTRRGDIDYVDGNGNALSFETLGTANNGNSTYGRRSDWKNLYAIAKEYFQKALDHKGDAKFITVDPRTGDKGRTYGNPYQYFFQQLHENDYTFADESIYEETFDQGASGNDPRPYSLGRPSGGGSSNAYPCKSYGQGRINPAFYYGKFDPKDLRRDVCCAVTGSDGKGREQLIPFTMGSTVKGGGIACNKFDENRQSTIWVKNQRRSGVNAPYMRMSEMYLGLAEAAAALGDDATAKANLKIIRDRAFGGDGNVDAFIASEASLLKAVIDERGFEFAGEGDRRFTLIRTGLLPEKIREIKELTKKMIDGLKANGYYTFENGNTISNKVYIKMVDAKATYGHRLTAQCPAGSESDPVLYPSWRGQNDNWESYGANYGGNTATNVAIKGLFTAYTATDVAAWEADGYTAQAWGSSIVSLSAEYYDNVFKGYDYVKAPIYLFPFTPNTMATGGFTNGYGFKQE